MYVSAGRAGTKDRRHEAARCDSGLQAPRSGCGSHSDEGETKHRQRLVSTRDLRVTSPGSPSPRIKGRQDARVHMAACNVFCTFSCDSTRTIASIDVRDSETPSSGCEGRQRFTRGEREHRTRLAVTRLTCVVDTAPAAVARPAYRLPPRVRC
ncbi:hypothetical protein L227DRAFT_175524 [Lentinus tigrinus ALCF2SS1-6]|uniref:Uncharacterized protein n=1 Tax=Lentinus tigrinus ALCF2SS1-6 TaxID=1328759 RepID=A0A5C2S584_9APHY|nr:hypothetical protein L227DRAFT_175524 [Lentinus tigrinus ALCF2SS1-6]